MKLTGLVVPATGASPFQISFNITRNATLGSMLEAILGSSVQLTTIEAILGSSAQLTTTDPTCTLVTYSQPGITTVNEVVRELSTHLEVTGTCILFGEETDGRYLSVPKTVISSIQAIIGKKSVTNQMPKRPKSSLTYFVKEFHRKRKASRQADGSESMSFVEVNKLAVAQWKTMSDEQKEGYIKQATEDHARYDLEMTEYRSKNRRPPKRPANAYNFYCQTSKKSISKQTPGEWKSMSEELKLPFLVQATNDIERYNNELKEYKEWCLLNNIDYESSITRKKRKRSETVGRSVKQKTDS
jgi:hypothetical protein